VAFIDIEHRIVPICTMRPILPASHRSGCTGQTGLCQSPNDQHSFDTGIKFV